MEPVIFNGVRYYKEKLSRGGYWKHNGEHEAPATLHQAIWEHHNGPQPTGTVVHHIDENVDHNTIENFQLLTNSEHIQLHMRSRRPKPQHIICRHCGTDCVMESVSNKKIIFCSPRCAVASWQAAHPKEKKLVDTHHRACPHCHAEFNTIYPTKIYCKIQCHRNAAKKRSRAT